MFNWLFNPKYLIFIFGVFETLKIFIIQSLQIEGSAGAWEIAKDFPVLMVALAIFASMLKYTDKNLDSQRANMKEIYEANQAAVKEIYTANRQDVKEIHMAHQKFVSDLVLKLQDRQNTLESSQRDQTDMMCEIKELLERNTERGRM